jgi:DNA-binding transcriptional LysR family regulator
MAPLPDFEAWAIFAKVADTGSFAGAAEELALAPATVSKAIQRLEARLGERLIHRTSRRFALTDAGRVLAVRAAQILADGEAVEAEAQAKAVTPKGRVRLAAPMSFGLRHVAPVLPEFLEAWPEVSIDLQLDDRVTDLVADGIDIALRIAELADSSLLARRLCEVRRWVVASPDYIRRHGAPEHPRDLSRHACLGYSYLASGDSWRFTNPAGEEAVVRVKGPLTATNGDALNSALEAGLGIALQPDFIVWELVRDGRLQIMLPAWSPPRAGLNIVTPPGGPRPARVSALLDFLAQRFKTGNAPWTSVA